MQVTIRGILAFERILCFTASAVAAMNPREKSLSAIAGALLAAAVFSMSVWPVACLTSAICGLALALYLRHRGAFRDDNAPLVGALLIGGSGIMVLMGVIVVSARAALIVMVVILAPILLFLLVFGIRERLRASWRNFQSATRDEEDRPP